MNRFPDLLSITQISFPTRKSRQPVICGQNSKSKTEIKSKTVLQFRSQSTNPTSPLSKSAPNYLQSASFRNSLSSNSLALGFQLPSKVLKKDVPYGKIIQTPFSTKPLKILPGFPVPIPGIVILTAGSTFPAIFDSDFFEIGSLESDGNLGGIFPACWVLRNIGISRMLFGF
jgi:hypothetical protein